MLNVTRPGIALRRRDQQAEHQRGQHRDHAGGDPDGVVRVPDQVGLRRKAVQAQAEQPAREHASGDEQADRGGTHDAGRPGGPRPAAGGDADAGHRKRA
jgi:hypothetical protein